MPVQQKSSHDVQAGVRAPVIFSRDEGTKACSRSHSTALVTGSQQSRWGGPVALHLSPSAPSRKPWWMQTHQGSLSVGEASGVFRRPQSDRNKK